MLINTNYHLIRSFISVFGGGSFDLYGFSTTSFFTVCMVFLDCIGSDLTDLCRGGISGFLFLKFIDFLVTLLLENDSLQIKLPSDA